MNKMRLLTDDELEAAKRNLARAKASSACEGFYLNPEEEALFKRFENERLPHDERRRQFVEFSRARRAAKAHGFAAE
jgi:hypothetical protein